MRCNAAKKRMQDYLDGRLSPEPRERFESHLAVCPRCRAGIEAGRRLREALRRRPVEPLAAGYWESFWPRLKEKLQPSSRPRRFPRFLQLPGLRPAVSIALVSASAAVLLTVTAVLMLRPREGPAPRAEFVRPLASVPQPEADYVVARAEGLGSKEEPGSKFILARGRAGRGLADGGLPPPPVAGRQYPDSRYVMTCGSVSSPPPQVYW